MFLSRSGVAIVMMSFGMGMLAPAGCGAKSGVRSGAPADAGRPQLCESDEDCGGNLCEPATCVETVCVPKPVVSCDDFDPCTEDSCAPDTGKCDFQLITFDLDADGFNGPRAGFARGSNGACGDDCDDASAKAHPGGLETCDGVDNDCNGIVDDGADYEPRDADTILVSGPEHEQAGRGGLVWNGEVYGTTYAGQQSRWKNYFKGLTATGSTALGPAVIVNAAGDVFTGPVVWTGAVFATAWEDRRQGESYDIYFNRFDGAGKKLAADVRVTDRPGFSLHADVLWNGTEFLVTWDDDSSGQSRVIGQRVSPEGELRDPNQELTPAGSQAESPRLAEGETSLGLAFNLVDGTDKRIGFLRFGADLKVTAEPIVLSGANSVSPVVAFSGDRYIVAWEKRTTVPGDAIWGAAIGEDGSLKNREKRLTSGSTFARSAELLPLGDRLLLLWAEFEGDRYQLFSKMLSTDLNQLSPPKKLGSGSGDSLNPIAAFGPNGDVGILFENRASKSWQVRFQRLLCVTDP